MDRPERPSRDKVQVTPDATRPDLFQFLEKLFDGADQKPERIELRQAYGEGARKYGTIVIQKEYKANAAKPTREALVSLSNELLDLAQRNCNELRKPYRYAILAKHYAKSADYYGCFLLSMRPKQPAMEGDDGGGSHGSEDDDDLPSDAKRRDMLLDYTLSHMKQSDDTDKWRQDQHTTATGDIIEKYQSLVQMLMSQNLEMQREHRELFKTADEALSKKSERDLASQMQEFKIAAIKEAGSFVAQMVPVALQKLEGRNPALGEKSPESMGIKKFMEDLMDTPQATMLFGEQDPLTKQWHEGIFTLAQTQILAGVAECKLEVSALDKLFDGEHAVTQVQLAKIQSIIPPEKLMPIAALIFGRKAKQIEATSAQPSP